MFIHIGFGSTIGNSYLLFYANRVSITIERLVILYILISMSSAQFSTVNNGIVLL